MNGLLMDFQSILTLWLTLLTGKQKFLMVVESVRADYLHFLGGLLNGSTKRHKRLTWKKFYIINIVVWFFCCYLFSLISSLYYVSNVHRNCLSIKTDHTSLRCVRPCLVTRQVFEAHVWSKHGGLFSHFLNILLLFQIFLRSL